MTWLALAALCPLLMIAPGAWIAFTIFDRKLGPLLRLALAIAFSPVVLGLQVLLLSALNFPFALSSQIVLLNILAFALMLPKPAAADPIVSPKLWALLAVVGVLVLALLAEWLIEPGLRTYSWHNMMQAAPVYEIARLPEPVEEWDLAGFGVHFAWLGHIQIAVIAKLADASPFFVHPIANIFQLFATFALLSACVLRFRPQARASAAFAALGALISTNLLGILLHYAGGVLGGYGDTRLCAIFYKFFNFDLMTNGIALACGGMLTAIIAAQSAAPRRWLIAACLCAAAVALIYPLIFPVLLVLIASAAKAPKLYAWLRTKRLTLTRDDGVAALAIFGALLVFALNFHMISGEGQGLVRRANPREAVWGAISAFKAVALWLPLLLLALMRAWRERDPARTALFIASAVGAALFVVTQLPTSVQYKFIFVGMLALMPIVADEALRLLERFGKRAPLVGGALLALIAALVAPHFIRDHAPWFGVVEAPEINEDHFIIEPVASEFAWTLAVRDQTTPDAVILYPPSQNPVSVFAQRASYVALDTGAPFRFGYLMSIEETLMGVKSLPANTVTTRTDLVLRAFAPDSDFAAVAAELAQLGRPIAIAGGPDTPFIAWLSANGIGHPLYRNGQPVAWSIDGPVRPRHF